MSYDNSDPNSLGCLSQTGSWTNTGRRYCSERAFSRKGEACRQKSGIFKASYKTLISAQTQTHTYQSPNVLAWATNESFTFANQRLQCGGLLRLRSRRGSTNRRRARLSSLLSRSRCDEDQHDLRDEAADERLSEKATNSSSFKS